MPKEYSQRIDPRRTENVQGPSADTAVVARPVDTMVAPATDTTLTGLIEGLGKINPEILRYGVSRGLELTEQGKQARATGKPKDNSAFESWQDGYVIQDARVAATNDAQELATAYQTGFDRSSGDIEKFITEFYEKKAKGLDPQYREHYDPIMGAAAQKVREAHKADTENDLVNNHLGNAQERVAQVISQANPNNGPVDNAAVMKQLDKLRTELNGTGLSNSKFNELMFNAMFAEGKNGNFGVYQLAREPRPDGTPGLASIPAFASKIAEAEVGAENRYFAIKAREENAQRAEREKRLDDAMAPIVIKAFDDPDAARADWRELYKANPGLFKAADVYLWDQRLGQMENTAQKAEHTENETGLLVGIYENRVGYRQVAEAAAKGQITPNQARGLMAQLRSVQSQNRQDAAAARSADNSVYRTPEFTSNSRFVSDSLRPSANPMDIMGHGTDAERQLRADAEREFSIRAKDQPPEKLAEIANDIVQRYGVRLKQVREAGAGSRPGYIMYDNVSAARQAFNRGDITIEQLDAHTKYFKANRR